MKNELRYVKQHLWRYEYDYDYKCNRYSLVLQAGLPETTHLVHKANHAVKPTSLRLSKQR